MDKWGAPKLREHSVFLGSQLASATVQSKQNESDPSLALCKHEGHEFGPIIVED